MRFSKMIELLMTWIPNDQQPMNADSSHKVDKGAVARKFNASEQFVKLSSRTMRLKTSKSANSMEFNEGRIQRPPRFSHRYKLKLSNT
jgi:hypothetical protein